MASVDLNFRKFLFVGFILLAFAGESSAQKTKASKYVVIGYVGGRYDSTMVDPNKLTHINYAFVNLKGNRAYLGNPARDTVNFRNLVKLKKRNPDLKILISIGGWGGCRYFSDAVLSDTAREGFAASAVNIVRKYNLDGVDIDWEYPNDIGAGNIFRPVDKQNYTLMFQKLRLHLDTLEKETGRKMCLTTAVGGFSRYLQQTEMDKASKYLDYVSLMTYDFAQDSLHIVLHHTNLYASKQYNTTCSGDMAARDFIAAGVPPEKLVMGVAFYSHTLTSADATSGDNVLGTKSVHVQHKNNWGGGYTFLKDSLINQKGFKYYRDKDAKAPYLFNADTKQFVTFDDEWSVKNKCKYVKQHHLAGVMFWEYSSDRKEYLLDEMNKDLK
jgi:chitinase